MLRPRDIIPSGSPKTNLIMSSSKEQAIALLKETPYFYDASEKLLDALSGT